MLRFAEKLFICYVCCKILTFKNMCSNEDLKRFFSSYSHFGCFTLVMFYFILENEEFYICTYDSCL